MDVGEMLNFHFAMRVLVEEKTDEILHKEFALGWGFHTGETIFNLADKWMCLQLCMYMDYAVLIPRFRWYDDDEQMFDWHADNGQSSYYA